MDKKKKDKAKKQKDINLPMKFNLGTLKFEPQIEETKEKIDELEKIKQNGKRKDFKSRKDSLSS